MGKLINCLDLRNGKIKVNGEEFMALPVAFNESFSWVVCEWQHLSKLTKNRFTIVYNVDPLSVEYVVIGKLQHTTPNLPSSLSCYARGLAKRSSIWLRFQHD